MGVAVSHLNTFSKLGPVADKLETYIQLYEDQVSFAAGFYVNGTFHMNVKEA